MGSGVQPVATGPSLMRPGIFYGWLVVTAAFAVCFIGFGSAYTFSVFLRPLQQEFGASRGSVSLVFALAGFLYFSIGAITGPLADRWGARWLAAAGMLLVAAGLASAALSHTLLGVYAGYGLGVGLGVGFSYVPAVGAVQHWFTRRRGLASGLAVSGIGVGTLVMPAIAAFLIGTLGWRSTYLVLAAIAAVAGTGMALLLEDNPGARGLGPEGEAMQPPAARGGMPVSEALRSRRFIGMYSAGLVCSFGLFVPFVHLVPYANDHDLPPSAGVLLLGAIGIGSTVGRFMLGSVADRVGRSNAFAGSLAGMALAYGVWAFSTGIEGLMVFAVLYGVFYGGFVALAPALVMDCFGARSVSSLIGILYTSVAFGTLIGPAAAGWAFDLAHSYTLPIAAGLCANLIAAGVVIAAFW
jgi:MFS family permease